MELVIQCILAGIIAIPITWAIRDILNWYEQKGPFDDNW